MNIDEIHDHLDSLSEVSNLRGKQMGDVVNGHTVVYNPKVDRYKINGTGGRWGTRLEIGERLLG